MINKEEREAKIVHTLVLVFGILLTMLIFSINSSAQTKCEVDSVIRSYGIKHPDVVLKQSILETGWYESYSCRERKNLFGFYYKKKFLEFETWEDSVAYYARWQKRHLKDECCDDYYDFLECMYERTNGDCVRYAADPEYINKLKSIEI